MEEDSAEPEDIESVKQFYNQVADEYDERHYSDDPAGYGQNAIRRNFTIDRLEERGVSTVLDAGCGDGSVMIPLLERGIDVTGFDFSENMVAAAKEKLDEAGYDPDRVSHGDITEDLPTDETYDAVIALGVFPHLSDTRKNLKRIRESLEPGGVFMAEFRNDLFDIFTLNEYSYEFYKEELFHDVDLPPEAETALDQRLRDAFKMTDTNEDAADDADDLEYGDTYSTFDNPFVVREDLEATGYDFDDFYFYHYHSMLPEFEDRFPETFREQSLALEDPTDWRGFFMASAYVVEATR